MTFFVQLTFANNAAYILDSSCIIKNGYEELLSGKAFVPNKRFRGVNANIYDRYLLCKVRSHLLNLINY